MKFVNFSDKERVLRQTKKAFKGGSIFVQEDFSALHPER
jgi:hypothetical protein